jgi:hypothetical protein
MKTVCATNNLTCLVTQHVQNMDGMVFLIIGTMTLALGLALMAGADR